MRRAWIIATYESSYTDPCTFSAGETLTIGKRKSEWDGWVWCTNQEGKSRWVPEAYVKCAGDICVMLRDYEATELSVRVGEELIITGEEESGWVWCTNQAGQSGWVPGDNVRTEEDE
ncbi:MAG: SH3 domain-containing protein [Anaerolineae bacterium]|nr:SH3 domain-containing protein [Anaerolineae bacterium]